MRVFRWAYGCLILVCSAVSLVATRAEAGSCGCGRCYSCQPSYQPYQYYPSPYSPQEQPQTPGQEMPPEPSQFDLASPEGFASAGETFASAVGYIDNALIRRQVRMRFEAAYDIDRPDRAEFLYTTWDVFGGRAPSPRFRPDPNVDYQAFWLYYEHPFSELFSAFVEADVIASNPSRNINATGIGDMQAGIKLALLNCCDQTLTFQLKNYIPTGNAGEWLTAGHYSIEPGLLYRRQLGNGWLLEAELRDWIAIGGAVFNGQPYAGNVLRYGVGFGYRWMETTNYTVTPVVEFVGWSVLEGQKFDFDAAGNELGPVDADGDTIVNVKVGARIASYGPDSIYAGYGHSLTNDRWYRDIFRIEYRRNF